MLVLDGAYLVGTEPPVFRRNAPPGEAELQALVECLAERIGRALERQGVLVRDAESSFLELEPAADGPMADLLGHSITYRVAMAGAAGLHRPVGSARAAAAGTPDAVSRARRLKRVFGIEIEQCVRCGGRLKVMASIEEPELIERILAHRRERGEEATPTASLGARAPPQGSLF